MSGAVTTLPSVTERLEPVLDAVAERAARIDAAEDDTRTVLHELGSAGLLTLGAPGHDGTLADQARVARELAARCMASAFSTWAHRLAVEYVAGWAPPSLRDEMLAELATGQRAGATAMATAFQDALGLKQLPVDARLEGDTLVLDGAIPWASNLFADGAVVVVPARADDGRRLVVALRTTDPGVSLAPSPPLLALDATASTSVRLQDVRLPAGRLLTDRFLDFLAGVRRPFLLLQTALCLGLTDAALAGVEGRLTGTAEALEPDHDLLRRRVSTLDDRFAGQLEATGPVDEDVVRLRLNAAWLAVEASRHESAVRGGAGYVATSGTARRLREAAFLPVQSPTEAQLRWELSRSA